MSTSAWDRYQRPLEPADYAEMRHRLLSSGRWYGCLFLASAVLEVVVSAVALPQPEPLVRAVPRLLQGCVGVWLAARLLGGPRTAFLATLALVALLDLAALPQRNQPQYDDLQAFSVGCSPTMCYPDTRSSDSAVPPAAPFAR